MIPGDIVFYRPETVAEAVEAWSGATDADRQPCYFSGGTEIVTLAREGKQTPTDVVDLKAIPGARSLETGKTRVTLGAALTLNAVTDAGISGLVGYCAAGVADRTVRNSITLGGNICGMLPYREAVLPFLLMDGRVELAGPEGTRWEPVQEVFRKKLALRNGEFALRFDFDAELVVGIDESPVSSVHVPAYGTVEASGQGPRGGWFYHRRTAESRVDYPVTTVAMVKVDGELRLAVTGTWGYPHRAVEAEEALREAGARAETLVDAVPLKVKEDIRAGRDYRRALTVEAVARGLAALEMVR